MTGPESFIFLNEPGDIPEPGDWNDPTREKLWLYNLHYFHDLNARGRAQRLAWHRNLLARWIAENPPAHGNGWEAYPISMRIVNWVKWSLAGNALDDIAAASLATQARHLVDNIEWHVLGNHLWCNAKALVFAGAYFVGPEADSWLRQGLAIIEQELGEQILADGGHFERSTMYHAIVLEDLLDLLNLGRVYKRSFDDGVPARFTEAAMRMQRWLRLMTHPDGEIAFFNDAAIGIAGSPQAIDQYALRLGLRPTEDRPATLEHLSATGYVRLARGDAVAFLDAGAVGPDYLPGHAHADTLSFELSLGNERIIVNGGTSRYSTGPERQNERSTAAHSTVEVNGESSSEVWGAFRVARRARIVSVETSTDGVQDWVTASHNGYCRLPGRNVHTRSVGITEDTFQVQDVVTGPLRAAIARFHLGEGVVAEMDATGCSGQILSRNGRRVRWRTSTPAEVVESQWHPGFGITIPIRCLRLPLAGGSANTILTY
jgi:uncharacterized heparinase superfamily protein